MAQKLILPLNDFRLTCTYKHPSYVYGGKKATHYGIDASDRNRKDFTLWASGEGVVKAVGYDATVGNTIVIVYKNAILHDGSIRDLTFRYFHLKDGSIRVKVGDKVTKDTRLAIIGNTPVSKGMAVHLHLEVDKDTDDRYVCWSPTVTKTYGLIRKGVDSTIDPLKVLWVKNTAPDYQRYMADTNGWITESSKKLPTV